MRVKLFSALGSAALCGLLSLVAFAQTQTPAPPVAMPNTAATATQNFPVTNGDYVIGGGDEIDVRVYKQPEISGKYRVSESGYVDILFIGRQKLAGLSEGEATDLVRQQLRKYFKQPEVNVTVSGFNSQLITVVGSVRSPGRLPLKRAMRVLDVVALSGGLIEDSGRFVQLIRYVPKTEGTNNGTVMPAGGSVDTVDQPDIDVQSINIDEILAGNSSNNLLLKPGDIVSVPKADVVYVAGFVRQPGTRNARNPLTIRQAVALCGGFADGAKYNDMRLYRTIPGKIEREEIKVSWKDIQNGKQKDLFLQANDVLYVPNSELKAIGQSFIRTLPSLVAGALFPLLVR